MVRRLGGNSPNCGKSPTKKTAVARTGFEARLATCNNCLGGLRDRALLCFECARGIRQPREVNTKNPSASAPSTQ